MLVVGSLVFFSLTFSNNESVAAINDYVSAQASNMAQYVGLQPEVVSSKAAKEEEKQRMEAEKAQEEGKVDEVLDDEAKKLLSYADDASHSTVGPKLANATFVTLVRNHDLHAMLESIKNVEERFNSKFHYPWVFLNNEEFTKEFKDTISAAVSGEAEFGLIPEEHWSYPEWIDQKKAAEARKKLEEDGVIYGGLESYRHMCRFESGFFWRHPLMEKYEWYWRVEPDIKLHCDVDYDVFKWMEDNDKVYGFTISIHEYKVTIETLWDTTLEFLKEYPQYENKDNMKDFISDDGGKTYNLCHFWSNFEVANMNFWRSDAYRKYFDYLDKNGGFFYERWGDAPVHSIAAALFLPRDKIHYFPDIGYYHPPYNNCPLDKAIFEKGKCTCDQENDFTFQGYSCGNKYFEVNKLKKPEGWDQFQ